MNRLWFRVQTKVRAYIWLARLSRQPVWTAVNVFLGRSWDAPR